MWTLDCKVSYQTGYLHFEFFKTFNAHLRDKGRKMKVKLKLFLINLKSKPYRSYRFFIRHEDELIGEWVTWDDRPKSVVFLRHVVALSLPMLLRIFHNQGRSPWHLQITREYYIRPGHWHVIAFSCSRLDRAFGRLWSNTTLYFKTPAYWRGPATVELFQRSLDSISMVMCHCKHYTEPRSCL